jgi:hypothetical protein
MRTNRALLTAVFFLIASVTACITPPPRPHVSLTAGAEPLRSQFNRDVGKVRLVIVAAPT